MERLPPATDDTAFQVSVTRWQEHGPDRAEDWVAAEEPLEIQVGSTSLAVVMRTPGHDLELVTGFLLTERIVESPENVLSLHHRSRVPSPPVHREKPENVVRVLLQEGVGIDLARLRRNLFASSSCGICGKATIDNATAEAPPLEDPTQLPASYFQRLTEPLECSQLLFKNTGGSHGAGLFDAAGRLLVVREDVGRHNAVDKVVGWALRSGPWPLAGHVLMISGRISYEIVQKALAARIPVIAAISAPTSLAVQLADRAGMTLVGFLRESRLNVYGRRDRVVEDRSP